MKIDITKYNDPRTNDLEHTKMQQRKMAREWLTDKNSGNSKGAWKAFVKERQDLKKIDEAKATDSELYTSLKNDPARYVEVMTHKYDGTKKPKDYPREITRIVKVEKPQPEKPKLKPKPKPFEIEYDWKLAPWQDYPEDDDVKKLVSQPSVEASNSEWWENEYYEYKKNGGDLPFLEFKRMMINEADIDMTKKINKIMKDKMKGEGRAALLGVRA